jgi:hypothetical protein
MGSQRRRRGQITADDVLTGRVRPSVADLLANAQQRASAAEDERRLKLVAQLLAQNRADGMVEYCSLSAPLRARCRASTNTQLLDWLEQTGAPETNAAKIRSAVVRYGHVRRAFGVWQGTGRIFRHRAHVSLLSVYAPELSSTGRETADKQQRIPEVRRLLRTNDDPCFRGIAAHTLALANYAHCPLGDYGDRASRPS